MTFDELISLAAEHRPDVDRESYGFRTRLEARLRELRAEQAAAGVLPLFNSWLWRTSIGLVPVILGLFWLFAASHGLSLPHGADEVVGQLTSLIPIEVF